MFFMGSEIEGNNTERGEYLEHTIRPFGVIKVACSDDFLRLSHFFYPPVKQTTPLRARSGVVCPAE
jgi:hypothetical protein